MFLLMNSITRKTHSKARTNSENIMCVRVFGETSQIQEKALEAYHSCQEMARGT